MSLSYRNWKQLGSLWFPGILFIRKQMQIVKSLKCNCTVQTCGGAKSCRKYKGWVESRIFLTMRYSEMNQINVTTYCQEITGCFAAVFDKVNNPVFFEGNYMDADIVIESFKRHVHATIPF